MGGVIIGFEPTIISLSTNKKKARHGFISESCTLLPTHQTAYIMWQQLCILKIINDFTRLGGLPTRQRYCRYFASFLNYQSSVQAISKLIFLINLTELLCHRKVPSVHLVDNMANPQNQAFKPELTAKLQTSQPTQCTCIVTLLICNGITGIALIAWSFTNSNSWFYQSTFLWWIENCRQSKWIWS